MTPDSPSPGSPDHTAFAIGFDQRDRTRFHELCEQVFDSNRWSEGPVIEQFEQKWTEWNSSEAIATSSWTGGAMAALEWVGVKDEVVLCPSNTFMATPLSVVNAGGKVEFVDCNREDLCMSFEDFERKAEEHKPKAAWLVHIGGHIAFDSEKIAEYCKANGIVLLEDCAHAHGADWNGKRPGTWGDAGVYSLYATKTVSTGEGGVLVTGNPELAEFAKSFRNYGKPDYGVSGLNYRMSEFTAALGLVQIERLDEIIAWKNKVARALMDPQFEGSKLQLPEGMTSGLYKYIVFEMLEKSTGRVYDEPCHRIMGHTHVDLPNSDWVAQNHSCPPIYYAGPELPEGVQ
ncbi:MAG: DegT/DnrJ/EryC1/StrS family aminotransferase [Actinomycetes bacterium]